MKLSIIVPIYGVEAYLDFCLKSIAQQGVEGMEVILVDDASPDGCGDICDRWAEADGRFRVVHCPENRGLSAARNTGIEAARGEYITFVDSDDYLAPNTLQANMELLERHPEADVLEYPVCVYHGTSQAYRYKPGTGEATDYAGWVRNKGYMHSYAWNKIYRRPLWSGVRFPEGRWFEDILTVPVVLHRARRILNSDKGLYYYCCRDGSISNTLCERSVDELLQARLQLYTSLLRERGLDEKDLDEMYLHLCDPQILRLQLGGSLCIPERKVPLRRAVFTRRPWNYRLKAILKALSGTYYCRIVAQTRKVFHS